jgi:hypothetical protein
MGRIRWPFGTALPFTANTAQFGDSTNYTQFEADGTFKKVGDATVWDDLRFPASAVRVNPATLKPDFDETNIGYSFDAAARETLLIIAQMPHSWKMGSDIVPHVHWQPLSDATGKVYWEMAYKWTNINGVEAAGWATVNILSLAAGATGTHQIASFGNVSGADKTLSSIISIKLARVGNAATDTHASEALLKEFDIHYEIDTLGSREEYVK